MDDWAIEVSGLTYAYPGGQKALEDVYFKIGTRESVALVGPNGAGKTTLFLCLAGVLSIQKGMVLLAGLDPADPVRRKQLPAKVGIVFPNSDDQLFHTTVFDDVAFGPLNLGVPPPEVRQRVQEALAQVGLSGFEQRVPFHLSGGEMRRAALAGVLAMRPEILLLDEPTIHLDPRGRRELIQLINSLNVTKLIATHDLELVLRTCQRAIILDHSRLVCQGSARDLFADAVLMESHGLEVPHSLTPHGKSFQHHDPS